MRNATVKNNIFSHKKTKFYKKIFVRHDKIITLKAATRTTISKKSGKFITFINSNNKKQKTN